MRLKLGFARSLLHILDVSSGKGTFACYYASKFGCRVTGIDINEKFVGISTKKAKEKGVLDLVDFKVGVSTKIPFPDNHFDVVVNECAAGLTVIDNPQGVLDEMYRVTKPDGFVVIHESTWLKDLDQNLRDDFAMKLGTAPYKVDEWKSMLKKSGVKITNVEDWSGVENMQKIRPDHKWNKKRPHDFMTFWEKLRLIPKIVLKYGFISLFELNRFQKDTLNYLNKEYYGYVLIIGKKDSEIEMSWLS